MDVVEELLSEIQRIQCLACVSRHSRRVGADAIAVPELLEALRLRPGEWEGLADSLSGERFLEFVPSAGAPTVRLTASGIDFLRQWEDSLQPRERDRGHD